MKGISAQGLYAHIRFFDHSHLRSADFWFVDIFILFWLKFVPHICIIYDAS